LLPELTIINTSCYNWNEICI